MCILKDCTERAPALSKSHCQFSPLATKSKSPPHKLPVQFVFKRAGISQGGNSVWCLPSIQKSSYFLTCAMNSVLHEFRDRCNTWPKLNEHRGSCSQEEIKIATGTLPLVCEENIEDKYDDEEEDEDQEEDLSNNASRSSSVLSTSGKSSARRNPWGNYSYADLITQAIQSSVEQRLTLSQIYEWLVKNISFFSDKGDSNSSAGWKNSIRHNLSLHQKFVRIQNEGTGKSSWWIINPDIKPGTKLSRRRAMSMETSSARQRKNALKNKLSPNNQLSGRCRNERLSLSFSDFSTESDFIRPRSGSTTSSCGGRLSPLSYPSRNNASSHCLVSNSPPDLTPLSPHWMTTNSNSSQCLSPTFTDKCVLHDKDSINDNNNHRGNNNDDDDECSPNLEDIKLNDLNLDFETSQLLDNFLRRHPHKSEAIKSEPTEEDYSLDDVTHRKLKILEQREPNLETCHVSYHHYSFNKDLDSILRKPSFKNVMSSNFGYNLSQNNRNDIYNQDYMEITKEFNHQEYENYEHPTLETLHEGYTEEYNRYESEFLNVEQPYEASSLSQISLTY